MTKESLRILAGGAVIVLFTSFLSKLINYFFKVIAARGLGPEEYGILVLGSSILGFFGSLAVFNLNIGIERYIGYYADNKEKIKGVINFSSLFVIFTSLVLSFLLFVFRNQISLNFFKNPLLLEVLPFFIIAIPFYALLGIFLSAFRGFGRAKYSAVLGNFSEAILKVLIILLIIPIGLSLTLASSIYPLVFFVLALTSFIVLNKKIFNFVDRRIKSEKIGKELLIYSYPLLFSSALWILASWIDSFMIGFYLSEDNVGVYNIAFSSSSLITLFLASLVTLFIPVVSGLLSKKDVESIKEIYSRTARWNFLIGSLMFVFLFTFAEHILSFFFGAEYVLGSTAMRFLLIGSFLALSLGYGEHMVMAYGKTKLSLYARLISIFSNILLNILLIPIYGIIGAAIATSISFFLLYLILLIFVKRKIGMLPFNKIYRNSLLSFATSLVLVIALAGILQQVSFFYLVLYFVVFLVVFTVLIFLSKSVDREDFNLIKSIIARVRRTN